MCAMMPMLRTLFRSVSTSRAIESNPLSVSVWVPTYAGRRGPAQASPAVVRERLVRFGHLVGVFATLDARAQAVAGVQQLVLQPLDHRLLAAGPRVRHQPAQRQRGGTAGLDLDRHLVGGSTDATALHLDGRPDVVQRPLEGDDRVGAGLLAGALQSLVDDALGLGALAVLEHLVDQLADQRRVVNRVVDQWPLRGRSLTRHQPFSFFAPYRLRACLRFFTPCVSRAPRMIL